jgi:hypothetical protein
MPKTRKKPKRNFKPVTIYLKPEQCKQLEEMTRQYQTRMSDKIGGHFPTSVADFIRRLIDRYGKTFASTD